MKLCYMTWVCPEWDVPTIIKRSQEYGYHGVEFRVECDHKHGVELDASEDHLRWVKQSCDDGGIEMPCIATSQNFSSSDPQERRKQIELAKRYVALAAKLDIPFIRVFGGPIPEGVSRETATQYVAESVREAGEFAEGHNVTLGLETHDSFSRAEHALAVIRIADHPLVRCLWDIMHPITHGETMSEAFEHVKPYIVHCHIHDGIKKADGAIELSLLGEGIIDHFEAVRLLHTIGFQGHLSGEFINWLPPEEVLPQYAKKLREYEAQIQ